MLSGSVGRRRGAFTLIEVLVVVAIIALLLSILLPSLRQAKEQAKVGVCMANLATIDKGAMAYINAEKDRFPFTPGNSMTPAAKAAGDYPPLFSSAFGGNRSTEYGIYDAVGLMEKPLNKYVQPGKLGPDLNRNRSTPGPLRVYQCPSDDGARWNLNLNQNLSENYTCYTDIGTSYDENLNWMYYISYYENLSGAAAIKREWYFVDRFVPIMRKKGASRAVVVYEDVADYSLSTGLLPSGGFPANYRVPGWHNRHDYATLGFLDGHVSYTSIDWRRVKPTTSNPHGCTATWVVHQDLGDN
jgi:prepilin-type N-terminal cleavage/methylation domain-containing protein